MQKGERVRSDKRRTKPRRAEAPIAEVQKESEAQKVYGWRLKEFKRMGFDAKDARDLADSAAELRRVEQMIEDGCAHETAKNIAL